MRWGFRPLNLQDWLTMRFWLHFDLDVFSIVVWILPQLTAFVLKLQQKNLHGQKSRYCVVYGKLPLECCLFQLWNFSLFSASLMMVVFIEMGYQAICVFTNTMNSSAQLKDRELRLLVLFLLIILLLYTIEMRSSAALECATFVCFLRKLCVWEKICSKFVKP